MSLIYVIFLVFLFGFQSGCLMMVLARRWRCVDRYRAVGWDGPRYGR
jgi:hypothetical protein